MSRPMRVRRGDRVTLRTRYQRVTRTVGARERGGATILTTGDSMMQSLDAVLGDRLARRAAVTSDVRPGGGLTAPMAGDWLAVARRQVARLHPQATVIFLGTNDFYPVVRPDGTRVECCGEDWGVAYERRVRSAMEIYAQDGAGSVLWLTMPYAREQRRDRQVAAVNAALRRAAASVPGTFLIPMDEIFTPGGSYRRDMDYRGRRVRVREPDGFHLTPAGARIASDYVIPGLRHAGAL